MGLLPRGFGKGLLFGGLAAATWWALSDRRRRAAVVDRVMERTEGIPFPGTRVYALLAEQLMGGIYRSVAEDVVREASSGELLEIGGGPGHLAVEIGRRARDLDVTTMDISPDMTQMAESRVHNAGLGRQVKVALGNARDIPFPNDGFDYVISLNTLHHWRAPDLVLEEIYRVLKPGGKGWIYDLRREMPEERWDDLLQGIPPLLRPFFELGAMGSWRAAYTEGQIRDLLASSPFTDFGIGSLTVEMAGMKVEGLTRVTLRK